MGLTGYLCFRLYSDDQRIFLPGHSTDGHYQIELDCQACHTPMMGIKENACLDCHGPALEAAKDSHPKKKFTDPRNADRVAKLDARKCITCHVEHRPERTRSMGVTLPDDYCFHCHEDIATERPSHKGYDFQSCATAGCHNFHDNTALYEDFLAKHLDEPDFLALAKRPQRSLRDRLIKLEITSFLQPLQLSQADAPSSEQPVPQQIQQDWLTKAHARSGVNCTGCHTDSTSSAKGQWMDKVSHTTCQNCHEAEVTGWLAGKHGMRLAQGLSPMKPGLARLPMKSESHHESLSCTSCHTAHRFETRAAEVQACMRCHDDEHSKNYFKSPHYELWQTAQEEPLDSEPGVSCASCHLPRIRRTVKGQEWVYVQHNQNDTLEPNERMIRAVCLDCHGLGFAIDSLADHDLIRSNFQESPQHHVESIDLVKKRLKETRN